MNYSRKNNQLYISLSGDFNLNAVHEINDLLSDTDELHIDLERSRFVNSEAIIFLHKQVQQQRVVHLKNPPKIFYEAIKILGLHETWDLKNIIER